LPKKAIFPTLALVWIVLLGIILSACSKTPTDVPFFPTPNPTTSFPKVNAIMFYKDQTAETYAIKADGQGTEQVVEPYHVNWSPNGLHMVFMENYDLYIVNVKTRTKTRITDTKTIDNISEYTWSPDGKKILIASHNGGAWEDGRVYLVNIEESQENHQESIKLIRGGVNANGLTWSPNGEYVAFFHRFELHEPDQIDILDAATGKTVLVLGGREPAWSPDGQKMVFLAGLEGKEDIYLLNDLTKAFQEFKSNSLPQYHLITHNSSYYGPPIWSPDGKKIAFTSYQDENWEVYVIDADGTNQTRLTNDPAADTQPAWSPDGKQIAFVSNRDGNREIYVVDADGSNLLRLTNNDVDDWGPVWQPISKP
jgi:Tol biopolymer transport system component